MIIKNLFPICLLLLIVDQASASVTWRESLEDLTDSSGNIITPGVVPGGGTNRIGASGITNATLSVTDVDWGLSGTVVNAQDYSAAFQFQAIGGGSITVEWDNFTPSTGVPNIGGIPISRAGFDIRTSGNVSQIIFTATYSLGLESISPGTQNGAVARVLGLNGLGSTTASATVDVNGDILNPGLFFGGGLNSSDVAIDNANNSIAFDFGNGEFIDLDSLQGTTSNGTYTNTIVTLSPTSSTNFIDGAAFRVTFDGAITTIPEPSSFILLSLCGVFTLMKRRRL